MFRGQFLRSTQPISGVSVLLLFPERTAVYLYCDKLKRASHPKHSSLPTLYSPFSPTDSTILHFSFSLFVLRSSCFAFEIRNPIFVFLLCQFTLCISMSSTVRSELVCCNVVDDFLDIFNLDYVFILRLSLLHFNRQISFIRCFCVVRQKFPFVIGRFLDVMLFVMVLQCPDFSRHLLHIYIYIYVNEYFK
jgi:hypothetical protein